jgi:hypothetical protein
VGEFRWNNQAILTDSVVPPLDRYRYRPHCASARAGLQLYRQPVRSLLFSQAKTSTDNPRYTYPGAWINTFVAGGLIYLRLSKSENWSSPWQTYLPVPVIYLCLNIFLVVTPFIPPNSDWNADGYPYYAFPLVGTGVLVLGAVYWLLWTRVFPRWRGYTLDARNGGMTPYSKTFQDERPLVEGVEEPLLGHRDHRGYGYDSINA